LRHEGVFEAWILDFNSTTRAVESLMLRPFLLAGIHYAGGWECVRVQHMKASKRKSLLLYIGHPSHSGSPYCHGTLFKWYFER
jgi:hypothetical protein